MPSTIDSRRLLEIGVLAAPTAVFVKAYLSVFEKDTTYIRVETFVIEQFLHQTSIFQWLNTSVYPAVTFVLKKSKCEQIPIIYFTGRGGELKIKFNFASSLRDWYQIMYDDDYWWYITNKYQYQSNLQSCLPCLALAYPQRVLTRPQQTIELCFQRIRFPSDVFFGVT